MTCEIVVMNKSAVVIAADSAMTVGNFKGGESYLKGVNKIFQLSLYEPVGIMIYGSSEISGVPWELIIKSFRNDLSTKKFPQLSEYAESFFSYINATKHIFPNDLLDSLFVKEIDDLSMHILARAINKYPILGLADADFVARTKCWSDWQAEFATLMGTAEIPREFPESDYLDATEYLKSFLSRNNHVNKRLLDIGLFGIVTDVSLYLMACETYFKDYKSNFNFRTAGIVFSGYGSEQYFPEAIEYTVHGFFRYSFQYQKVINGSCAINHEQPSWLIEYPESLSIQSFTKGIDKELFNDGVNLHRDYSKKLILDILNDSNVQIPSDLEGKINELAGAFANEWKARSIEKTFRPMLRVVSLLPVSDMVYLAENLITLQSLKNRMTTFGESVSGAIDIAVITKSEGLVWVRRKHFFDSAQNLRYVLRQKSISDSNIEE